MIQILEYFFFKNYVKLKSKMYKWKFFYFNLDFKSFGLDYYLIYFDYLDNCFYYLFFIY